MDGLMFDTEKIGYEGWKYGKKLGIHEDELIASFSRNRRKKKSEDISKTFGSEEFI